MVKETNAPKKDTDEGFDDEEDGDVSIFLKLASKHMSVLLED